MPYLPYHWKITNNNNKGGLPTGPFVKGRASDLINKCEVITRAGASEFIHDLIVLLTSQHSHFAHSFTLFLTVQ